MCPLEFQRAPWLRICRYAPNSHQNLLPHGQWVPLLQRYQTWGREESSSFRGVFAKTEQAAQTQRSEGLKSSRTSCRSALSELCASPLLLGTNYLELQNPAGLTLSRLTLLGSSSVEILSHATTRPDPCTANLIFTCQKNVWVINTSAITWCAHFVSFLFNTSTNILAALRNRRRAIRKQWWRGAVQPVLLSQNTAQQESCLSSAASTEAELVIQSSRSVLQSIFLKPAT